MRVGDVRRPQPGITGLLIALLLLGSHLARGQEVGTVAALEGTASIGRAGEFADAALGAPIQEGDELRTGRPGRLRVVFQDDTVLTVSDDSRVVIDEQVFKPQESNNHSLLRVLAGKVNAVVSEYYHRPGSVYEVRTTTAVAGVRGTEFITTYDALTEVTEVAGLSGRVEVHSVRDPASRGVFVTAHEVTTVTRGQLPTPPRRLSDTFFRQYMEGIEFIGRGSAESLTVDHPLLAGASVPKADRATAGVTAARAAHQVDAIRDPRDASGLVQQPPPIFGTGGKLRIPF